jgi:hypothetical protein
MVSVKRSVIGFAIFAALALPFVYFFMYPIVFWIFFGVVALYAVGWAGVLLSHRANQDQFGDAMTLDEIVNERDPQRIVQLLRYHLGWSAGKIAAELNRKGITNLGRPWTEEDVRQAVKGIGKLV